MVPSIRLDKINTAVDAFQALDPEEQGLFLKRTSLVRKAGMEWLGEALNSGEGVYRP